MKLATTTQFISRNLLCLLLLLGSLGTAQAQSNTFTYQGRLTDSSLPANATYDFQFSLFDALAGGTQVGATNTRSNVAVANGTFTVSLDFGNGAFPGASRFLEIAVRLAGGGAFTTLAPRQAVTSTPYAIQSLNAATANSFTGNLAGDVTGPQGTTAIANNAVTTSKIADANVTDAKIANGVAGSKLTGSITIATIPAANITGTVAIANGGTGSTTKNFVDLTTAQSVGGNKTFTGTIAAGSTLTIPARPGTTGTNNSFIGAHAGFANTTGASNTIMGDQNFNVNTVGSFNTGMGFFVLNGNTSGNSNTGFGVNALRSTTTANNNTAVGRDALINNSTGSGNIALGFNAGQQLTTGSNNIHIGNVGVAGESGIIRIGTAGNQTATFLTGVINGNGSGLTDLSAASIAAGTLAIARGGTGITAAPTVAGQFLRSTAANTWAVGTLAAGDVPSGSANYIQNGTALQASSNFNISGNGFIGGNLGIGNPVNNSFNRLDITNSNGSYFRVMDLGAFDGTRLMTEINGGLNGPQLRFIGAGASFMDIGQNSAGDFVVEGGDNARFVVQNTGNVGIGITSPARSLHVVDSNGRSGTIQVGSQDSLQAGDRKIIKFGDSNLTDFVYIGEEDADDRLVLKAGSFRFKTGSVLPDVDNSITLGASANRWTAVFAANGAIQTSDARLKKAVTNLGYGLSQVMQLRPVSFEWKDRTDGRNYLGLIAQEVEKIIPEAIERDKDSANPLGMSYTSLVPVLIKAVQEQQTTLEQKEAEIKTLNARLAALEQMMQQFKEQTEKQPKQQ